MSPAHRLVFRTHAIRRMFQRRIGVAEVRHIVERGQVIEDRTGNLPIHRAWRSVPSKAVRMDGHPLSAPALPSAAA